MSFSRRLDRSGTSLIEVLVTFVVFLIGIVSVLRLFPGGFLSMRHTENATLANRLAQTEIERWEGKIENLPSGILPWGKLPTDTTYRILTDIDPTNLEDPIPPGGYYFSDVNKFRRIESESTVIPVPSSANWNAGSIYVLGFSPIAYDANDPKSVVIYGGELRRRPLPRNLDELQLKQYSEYAIDYSGALLYLKPLPLKDRWFQITYSYWEETSGMVLYPAVGVHVYVPAATDPEMDKGYEVIQIPPPGGPFGSGFNGIDEGSDSLHREFDELQASGSWSLIDPYEFKVTDTIGGVIAFNPLGYRFEEFTVRGKELLTAHIDYNVLDWHIIREERKLPDVFHSAADQDVKLTLRFIKKSGETMEADGTTYGGLAPDFGLTHDVLAMDVETGTVYTQDQVGPSGNPVFVVNYKDGIVRFDPAFVDEYLNDPTKTSPFQGKTFRIYYRAEGDWGLQVFKAYDVYRRSYSYTLPLNHRQYYLDDYLDAGGHKIYIYFPHCYAGCAVAVDYSYRLNSNDPDRFITGESYRISDDTGTSGFCYIDLLAKLHEVHGEDAKIEFRNIAKVYGVSIGARVIWHETGRRLQVGAWRKASLQTYLTKVSD